MSRTGTAIHPLGTELSDWTTNSDLHLTCEAEVDIEAVLADAGLADDAVVGMYALVDCRASQLRKVTTKPIQRQDRHVNLEVVVGAGQLCDQIDLSRGLILLEPGSSDGPRVAIDPGARLAEYDTFRIILGNGRPRFPVESVDFRSLRLPPAAWILTVNAEGPTDSFLGSVRLMLNTDHRAVAALTTGEPNEQALIRSVLRTDTIRQLFRSIADDPRFRDGPFPDESIGGVMEAISTKELAMSLPSALQLLVNDPVRFDAELQARTHYLGGEQ